ncbi:MAG TPA: DedA family protein [Geothrix sp.]|nr:DedA family protein [Geothrix sp.]
MLQKILAPIVAWMVALMAAMGPLGVLLLMAIESACIPLPSEVIMPFAGYLAFKGQLTFLGLGAGSPAAQIWIAGVFGALGCNLGSIPAYEVGAWGGRRAIEKYGKYVWLHTGHLDQAHRFFERFGSEAIILGRLLPVVRTFIALPAGIARMNRARFHLYTFVGSLPWCLGLAWVGYKLGEKWNTLGQYFHKLDAVIGALIVVGVAWFVYDHVKNRAKG